MSEARDLLVESPAGSVLFERGDPGDTMYVVEDGEVEILLEAAESGEERLLAVLGPGDFFGEMAVLEGEPRSATARARTRCRLLPVRKSSFRRLIQNHPDVAVRVMRKLSARLRAVERELELALRAGGGGRDATWVSEAAASVSRSPPAPGGRLVERRSGEWLALPSQAELTLGRPDAETGWTPDLDLTAWDPDKTVSRRHARLVRRRERLYVTEQAGVINGTLINRRQIEAGREAEIRAGDVLTLGSVELTFEHG